jgi:glutathione S-transferase
MLPGLGRTPESQADIRRIENIWTDSLQAAAGEGPFLFGHFSIADAMYAPVVLRFHTYAVELGGLAGRYAETVLALPALQEWIAASKAEREVIAAFEPAGSA